MNAKVGVSIGVGVAIIIGIVVSFGYIGDSQNESILEESIEIVEEVSSDEITDESPVGREFIIELEESVSIKGE